MAVVGTKISIEFVFSHQYVLLPIHLLNVLLQASKPTTDYYFFLMFFVSICRSVIAIRHAFTGFQKAATTIQHGKLALIV
jgi:hypothetical protein